MLVPSGSVAQDGTSLRVATFSAPLSRDGPGLLLRDILEGEDASIAAIVGVLDRTSPDIVVLTDFDFDATGAAMAAFSQSLATPYPYRFSLRPNAGAQTGLDIDGDGFTGDARDALGYGRFLGDGGMAVLSRYPILPDDVTDLTGTLWRDIPGAMLPTLDGAPFPSAEVQAILPVSSVAHWIVPIDVDGAVINLLAFSATAPVFDGPEDFNGLRNRDELRLWEAVLDGAFGPPPANPILIGKVNTEPFDGDGLRDGITAVLARPDLQDPLPTSDGAREAANASHLGDPALDTAQWPADGPGNLRVSYVLPSSDLAVTGAGVFWPVLGDPDAALVAATGPHRLVWVDITTAPPR